MRQHVSEILQSPATTGTPRMVLIILAHFADENGNVYKTRSQIASAAGIKNPRHLDPHIKTLVLSGHIIRHKSHFELVTSQRPDHAPINQLARELCAAGVNPATANQLVRDHPEDAIRHGLQFKDKSAAYVVTCIRNPIAKKNQTPTPTKPSAPVRVPDPHELGIEVLRHGYMPISSIIEHLSVSIDDMEPIPTRRNAIMQALDILHDMK